MGVRCYRFAMIVKDGVVSYIGVEGSGEFGKSKAETILEELKK
jgi:peroxiredoxin